MRRDRSLSPIVSAIRLNRESRILISRKGDDVQYALLIYQNTDAVAALSEEERAAMTAEYWRLREEPPIQVGFGLPPANMATTVRVKDGQTLVSDGPFAETKEVFGGAYVIEADDLDGAIEIAARIPAASLGGSVEIRPVLERPS
jgi:hypothetical protein